VRHAVQFDGKVQNGLRGGLMLPESVRKDILAEYGKVIKKLERLESLSRYWLENKGMRKELKEIVEEMKENWKKLDLFMACLVGK